MLLAGCAQASTSTTAPTATSAQVASPTAKQLPTVAYLNVPTGFRATLYTSGLSGPRFMAFGPDGTLFVAERNAGRVTALRDPDHTGRVTQKVTVASGLNAPSSVVYAQGALYVGETTRISRLVLGPDLRATSVQAVVPTLPGPPGHTTRTVLIGPDGKIYVSIGSSCNVCIESDPHRAAVWVYNADGSGGRLFARGLRNAVGLAINPWNQQLWATNNGRDNLGDNSPPETIYALRDGANYGWPSCHAGTIVDPDTGHPGSCDGVEAPLEKMQAHSAPLGLAFYRQGPFPAQYHGVFVAFHGSWNRSVPTGYKVVFVPLDANGTVAGPPRDVVTGWLQGNQASGRPVGVTVGPDGALYVSDDKASLVYRITYTP
ncbi:MAG TPA: PQQ-dependent sugar dehydrogenase [Ktedonobacterales bacterium]|nr:PQQ-dependent sugar dehydrogenase [Ktedonobacterales bacterium]